MARLPKRIPAQAVVKKVRFSLPQESASDEDIEEEKPPKEPVDKKSNEAQNNESKVHGTAKYVNGTLNFCRTDYKPTPVETKPPPKKEKKSKKIKETANVMTFPRSALASNSHRPTESPVCSDYWTKAFNGCKVIYHAPASHNATPTKTQKTNRRRTRIRSCTTILLSPTRCIRRSACFRHKKKFHRLPNELQVPQPHSTPRRTKPSGRQYFIQFFTKPKFASKCNKISMQVIPLNHTVHKSSILLISFHLHSVGNRRTYFVNASVRSDTPTVRDRPHPPSKSRTE